MDKNQDSLFLFSTFLFMFILVPVVMILTVTVNSELPIVSILLFGTPVLTIGCCILAYWYLKHDAEWLEEFRRLNSTKK